MTEPFEENDQHGYRPEHHGGCDCDKKFEIFAERLQDILYHLKKIDKRTEQMAIDQATFDADLGGLVSAVNDLISAVAALPQTDLTAEDQAVQAAAANVQAELSAITPAPAPAPEPTPAPGA